MASGRSTSRPWLPYTSAVTAGMLVIGGAFVLVQEKPRTDCATLEVTSSTEKVELLRQLAKRYNDSDRSFGADDCATVNVSGLTSGKATEALAAGWSATVPGLPEPQVWLPTSTLWTGQLRLLDEAAGPTPHRPPDGYPSIANSPLVIAMPQPKGELVRQQGPLGWGEILGLSGREGWAELRQAGVGRVHLRQGQPEPLHLRPGRDHRHLLRGDQPVQRPDQGRPGRPDGDPVRPADRGERLALQRRRRWTCCATSPRRTWPVRAPAARRH